MKRYLISLLLFTGFHAHAWSKEVTVKLSVPSMNCVTCPITVKKALENVSGVHKAEVSYKRKLAVVTFDDEKTSTAELTEATKQAGFPSKIQPKQAQSS